MQLFQNRLVAWRVQLYVIYVKYELTLPGIFVRIECTIERLYGRATGLNMTSSSKYNCLSQSFPQAHLNAL